MEIPAETRGMAVASVILIAVAPALPLLPTVALAGPNANGSLIIHAAYDCGQAGGIYQGNGVGCDPDPCSVTPALDSSWGGVKTRYR